MTRAGSFGLDPITQGTSNYPYVTARIRSLKTHLLGAEEYPKLIARDVHEIARRLEEGQYKRAVNDLSSTYDGAQLIERATQRQMGDEFRRILSWCRGEPRALLGLYFERFTVSNIKTLLRGMHAGADREDIENALIPSGLLDATEWEPALNTDSFEACLDALPRTRYTPILGGLADERLPVVENALDRAYYEGLVEAIDTEKRSHQALVRFLRREIDVVNLKLLLRTKHSNVEPGPLVPRGDRVTTKHAERIQAADWSEVPEIVDEISFGDVLRPALETYLETRDLNTLTTVLEHLHIEAADEFGFRYPLSIIPLIEYVLRKQIEVNRLRMIAFGKQTGLSRDEIEELIGL